MFSAFAQTEKKGNGDKQDGKSAGVDTVHHGGNRHEWKKIFTATGKKTQHGGVIGVMRGQTQGSGILSASESGAIDSVTILGHNIVMKRAKISELKARLSSYLSDVRSGETIIVCERATPIAQLSPLPEIADDLKIREPERPIRELTKIRSVHIRKKMDVNKLLRETRGKQ